MVIRKGGKMKISKSTEYALLAAVHVAKNYKEGRVLSQQISKEFNIPLEYLLKILQHLVKANVLRSKRGPNGGFVLARDARKISLLQIIESENGPLVSQMNLSAHTNKKFSKKIMATCDKAIGQARDVYAKTSLADVMK